MMSERHPGWTVSDMKALLASKPEGTQLFWGMDRTSALTALMSLGYNDFINWEDASCNFDSQEFIDVLDFANMFPEEFEYRDDMEDSTVLLSQGKQLLDTYYLSDFEQVQMYRAIFWRSDNIYWLSDQRGKRSNAESEQYYWNFQ